MGLNLGMVVSEARRLAHIRDDLMEMVYIGEGLDGLEDLSPASVLPVRLAMQSLRRALEAVEAKQREAMRKDAP